MSTNTAERVGGREVSTRVVGMIFSYVERVLGPEAVVDLLTRAGFEGVTVAEMRDPARWFTVDETASLARAASEMCGDDGIGRRCGEELFRLVLERGMSDVFVATGSVSAACKAGAEYGSRMSQARPLWVSDSGEDYAIINSRVADPSAGHPFFCGVTAGYYGNVPSLFGQLGVIAETDCQLRGAPECSFRLTWRPDPTAAQQQGAAPDAAATAMRHDLMVRRFEQLQNMATELVGAEDVDDVLDRITQQVSGALDAPRYLLTARIHEHDRLRVQNQGFTPASSKRAADKLMKGEFTEADGVLVVDVASPTRTYGRLAAFFGPGSGLKDADRRMLGAYAGHAAPALEVIASLERARRDRDTAQVLLELAAALAEVGTIDDIGLRLSEVVPAVVNGDVSGVWLYDHPTGRVVLNAWTDVAGAAQRPAVSEFDMGSLPELNEMVERPRAFLFETENAPVAIRPHMARLAIEQVAIVPISANGSFLGVVTAGFRRLLSDDGRADVLTRLRALADHAATALQNAELLEQAQHQALSDRLTGLPNRSLVEDRGQQAFAAASRSGRDVGLLFIDLDRFKIVNDTLGHRAGDELICQVAQRMKAQMRASDTLARLGGDEFVVLVPELAGGVDDAIRVAERLIHALDGPFKVADQELFISCSIGIACSPQHGTDYESLLQYGDAAMYAAKAAGRGAFAVHAVGHDEARRNQLELESQLHRALENDELRVLYQPQIDMKTMRVVGVEALVRWQHPELGLLGPGAFLSLAEESGLVVAIDEWVRGRAFTQARQWSDAGRPLRVAVNLSTRALGNPHLAHVIAKEIESAGLPPGLVELEITDRVVMSDEELPAVLDSLKALGVRLAIDDFGTGSSVLRRLQSCPVDTLKIDRSFVQAVTDESPEAPLVKALLALAPTLELSVVAEGVETAAQGGTLRRYGCEMVQGFLFSPPVTVAEIDAMLHAQVGMVA